MGEPSQRWPGARNLCTLPRSTCTRAETDGNGNQLAHLVLHTPEARPYYIEERVNHTLWKNRLQTLFMRCVQVSDPVRMEGNWLGNRVVFEWQPRSWFRCACSRKTAN